jgi:hypothetical protein
MEIPAHSHKLAYQTASLFLLVLLMAFRPCNAFGQAVVAGTVSSVSGTVQIGRGAATLTATQGMPVQVGDRIVTGDDGHIVVLLTDQSTLELNDSTNMLIDQHAGTTTQVDLVGGVVRSFVNRTVGANAPNFEVHTPNAVGAARGTLFDTAFFSGISRPGFGDTHDFTDVSVYDGVVNLANTNNLAGGINIPAGFESTVAGMMGPTTPAPLGTTGAISLGSAIPKEVLLMNIPLAATAATVTGAAVTGGVVVGACAVADCFGAAKKKSQQRPGD